MVRKIDTTGWTLEEIEKLELKRQQTRERQRKFREKNEHVPEVPSEIEIPKDEPFDELAYLKKKITDLENQLKSSVVNESSAKQAPVKIAGAKMSKGDALDAINKLEFNKEGSKKQYIANMGTVLKILGTDNFAFINNPQKTYTALTTAKKMDGTGYSVNSIKQYLQFICWACDMLHLAITPKNKNWFDNKLGVYQIKSSDLDEQKSNDDVAIDMPSLLESIKNKYGENSRQNVLINLYNEAPVRDDMGSLILVDSLNKTKDPKFNYLIIPKKGTAKIHLNQYKNSIKNGTINTELSMQLTNLLHHYQKNNKININDKFFGGGKLSVEINRIMRSIGFNKGINFLRHSIITARHLNKELTAEERHKLAQSAGHSAPMDRVYIRKNIVKPSERIFRF